MNILQIFLEEKGKPSLKRILGCLLIVNGILGKNALCYHALHHAAANFDKIDNCFDGLIYGGIALIFGTIADKFFKKT